MIKYFIFELYWLENPLTCLYTYSVQCLTSCINEALSYKTNFHVLHLRIVKFFGFSWVFVIGEWGLNRSFTKTKVVENWQEWVIIIVLLPYDNNRGNRELVQNTMTSLWYYHQNQLHASKPTDAKKNNQILNSCKICRLFFIEVFTQYLRLKTLFSNQN